MYLMNGDEYLKERLEAQQHWHSEKSKQSQTRYKWLSNIEAVCIAGIPVILLLPCVDEYARYMAAFLGGLASVLDYINKNHNYHNLWIKYRLIAETLKREKYLYKTGTGAYKNKDNATMASILVENVEKILSDGNTKWEAIASMQENYEGHSQNV